MDCRQVTLEAVFFFSSRRRHTRLQGDWSSDVCSSDLYLLGLEDEKYHEVQIQVLTDRATLKPHLEDVSRWVHQPDISPSGKRAVFEARGEIFTVPAEHGVVRNLTRSSGVAERFPAWSPDGKFIAYFSDRSGEYQLCLRPADGSGEEEVLTKPGDRK